jgi:hypothetical protein
MSGPVFPSAGRALKANHSPLGEYDAPWPTTITSRAISTVPGALGDELTSTDGETVGLGESDGGALGGAELGGVVAVGAGVVRGVAVGGAEAAVVIGVAEAVVAGEPVGASDGDGLSDDAGESLMLSTETFSVCDVPLFPTTTTWSPPGERMTDLAFPFRSTGRCSVGAVVGQGVAASGQTCSTFEVWIV